jgi:broad specificity phosphatase PhoE
MMLPPKWILTGISEKNPFDERFVRLGSAGAVVFRDGHQAETDEEFSARVVAMTQEIQEQYKDSSVLVVAGARWIRTWFAYFKRSEAIPSLARGGIYEAEA